MGDHSECISRCSELGVTGRNAATAAHRNRQMERVGRPERRCAACYKVSGRSEMSARNRNVQQANSTELLPLRPRIVPFLRRDQLSARLDGQRTLNFGIDPIAGPE